MAHDTHILFRNCGSAGLAFRAHDAPARPAEKEHRPPRRLAPDQYCVSIGSATLVVEA